MGPLSFMTHRWETGQQLRGSGRPGLSVFLEHLLTSSDMVSGPVAALGVEFRFSFFSFQTPEKGNPGKFNDLPKVTEHVGSWADTPTQVWCFSEPPTLSILPRSRAKSRGGVTGSSRSAQEFHGAFRRAVGGGACPAGRAVTARGRGRAEGASPQERPPSVPKGSVCSPSQERDSARRQAAKAGCDPHHLPSAPRTQTSVPNLVAHPARSPGTGLRPRG